jgi:hypothetical protein
MLADHVLIAGQGMADQDRVGTFGVQLAVGLVGNLKRREIDAGIEAQGLLRPEADELGMRLVGLAADRLGAARRTFDFNADHAH